MKRIVLDWGRCHQLLDQLQIGCRERDLTVRLRWFIKQLVRQTGWPTGNYPAEWWEPIVQADRRRRRGKKRKR